MAKTDNRQARGSQHRCLSALLGTLFALTAGISVDAGAQIYKITDEDNGVEFTDRPQTGQVGQVGQSGKKVKKVEEVDLPALNTTPATQVRPPENVEPESTPQAPEPTVVITEPVDESTIAMGPGNFMVSAAVRPPLQTGERLLLLIDGQPHGEPQPTASWSVQGALRGPHDLRVQRQTIAGKTLAQSESVRIYVLRPSLLNR